MNIRNPIINRNITAFSGRVLVLGGTQGEVKNYQKVHQIQNAEDEFYTININENEQPDLVADFTLEEQLSSLAGKQFDIVYFSGVPINSVDEAQEALKNAYRLLKDDGVLLFRGMMIDSDKSKEKTVTEFLSRAGFQSVFGGEGSDVKGEKIIAFKNRPIHLTSLIQRVPVLNKILSLIFGRSAYRMTPDGLWIPHIVHGQRLKEECDIENLQQQLGMPVDFSDKQFEIKEERKHTSASVESTNLIEHPREQEKSWFVQFKQRWDALPTHWKWLAATGIVSGAVLITLSTLVSFASVHAFWVGIGVIKASVTALGVGLTKASAVGLSAGVVKSAAVGAGLGSMGTAANVATRLHFSPSRSIDIPSEQVSKTAEQAQVILSSSPSPTVGHYRPSR